MVFVAVGTQKFQFNRLLKAVDDLVEQGCLEGEVFAQIGHSDYVPRKYAYKDFISKDDFLNKRSILNIDEKQIIAQKAIQLLQPEETIFLDSGSTATMMAAAIPDEPRLIYTSGLTCAIELANLAQPRICLPGGVLNRYSHSVCGVSAIRELERIHFKQAFIGVTSFSYDTGFTCSIDEEARLKQLAIEHAQEVILLMDSSKLQKHSTFTFAHLDNVDIIVSDGKLPQDFLTCCQQHNVRVI